LTIHSHIQKPGEPQEKNGLKCGTNPEFNPNKPKYHVKKYHFGSGFQKLKLQNLHLRGKPTWLTSWAQ
jgi:hypothetical protein